MSEINPKVAKAAMRVAFDAAEYTWLDLSDMTTHADEIRPHMDELASFTVEKMPLLFERLSVLPPSKHYDEKSVVTISRKGGELTYTVWPFDRGRAGFTATVRDTVPFNEEKDVSIDIPQDNHAKLMKSIKGGPAEAQKWLVDNITYLLGCLYYATAVKTMVEETYTCPANPANVKRRRQGKVPMYEWKTLIIDSTIRKRVASARRAAIPRAPQREHDVRGHWVTSKLGKKFWRTAHKRGDASVGTIFHDYQTK